GEAPAVARAAGRRRADVVQVGRIARLVALLAVEEAVLALLAFHDPVDARRAARDAADLGPQRVGVELFALALQADEPHLLLAVAVGAVQFADAEASVAGGHRADRFDERREVLLCGDRAEADRLQRADRPLEPALARLDETEERVGPDVAHRR